MSTKIQEYRGKHFTIPQLKNEGFVIDPQTLELPWTPPDANDPVIKDLNTIWDTDKFLIPRKPISLGILPDDVMALFGKAGLPRTLDMPIKFPGSKFLIPQAYEQLIPTISRVAHAEWLLNPQCFDEYYCYMTVDQSWVEPGNLQREAPCHVDGFQGARWSPKVRLNHTYVIGNAIPTTYYVQPFDLRHLDEAKHNFFWEMNKIVAQTNSEFAWQPQNNELCLMDAYCVHRGSEATERVFRTWLRLSFEVRKFDRLGNAHNPMFHYDWEMLPRDIEGLNLVAFDENMDASLRVFPWQDEHGNALPKGVKTKPVLRKP